MRIELSILPALTLAAVLAAGCEGPTRPNDGDGGPMDGQIQVTTVTTGALLDADGYAVTVDDGDATAVGRNETVILGEALAEGQHEVELSDIAPNCEVWGENPKQVVVVAGETATALFEAACADPRALYVSVSASGSSFDADGYRFTVDGGRERLIDVDEAVTLFRTWDSGEHEIALEDVAANCTVSGANPLMVMARPNASTVAHFDVDCDYVPGEIAFTSRRTGNVDIYTMDASGSDIARLTLSGALGDPAWSPDGSRIAFTEDRDLWSWDHEIHVMNADGSGLVPLTSGSTPAWSPDGSRIAYANDGDIWVIDADGGDPVRLTNEAYDSWGPAWSPRGGRIAFTRSNGTGTDIYVMGDDGSEQVNLTDHKGNDSQPAWSPDGSKIAFTSDRDGNLEIYVMNAQGTDPVNVTNDSAIDYEPVWSPDGARIAFTTGRDGNFDVYVMAADGSDLVNLTNHPADDHDPAWSR